MGDHARNRPRRDGAADLQGRADARGERLLDEDRLPRAGGRRADLDIQRRRHHGDDRRDLRRGDELAEVVEVACAETFGLGVPGGSVATTE